MSHLTLNDVLRFHQREAGEARRRAQHPRASYNTRTAWEITADLHRSLAEVVQRQPAPLKIPEPPRFIEAFRIYLDDEHGERLLTGEWQHAPMLLKTRDDVIPKLAAAGRIGLIACTLPPGTTAKSWHGDADHPVIWWHLKPGAAAWACNSTEEHCLEWCRRKGVDFAIFNTPAGSWS